MSAFCWTAELAQIEKAEKLRHTVRGEACVCGRVGESAETQDNTKNDRTAMESDLEA